MKSLGKFPDPFIAEISGQPGAVRRAATGLAVQADALDEIHRLAVGRTPIFTGMGSSYDVCYPAITELGRAGIPALMLDTAELLHFRTGLLGPSMLLVAVSQSGESAEVVRLVHELRSRPAAPPVVTVTNGLDNSLARLADHSLDTCAGDETGPSTMTFAGSLVVVTAIGRLLAGSPTSAIVPKLDVEGELAAVAMERILAEVELPDMLVAWFGDPDSSVILGRGPARAAAEMGALTIKEAVGLPIESLQTAQFRHGPLELAGPALAAIVIATEPETLGLDLGLARELLADGAAVLLVTGEAVEADGAMQVATGPLDRALSPAVSILPAQLLAWRLAALCGRTPGAYYRGSKVTTRE